MVLILGTFKNSSWRFCENNEINDKKLLKILENDEINDKIGKINEIIMAILAQNHSFRSTSLNTLIVFFCFLHKVVA